MKPTDSTSSKKSSKWSATNAPPATTGCRYHGGSWLNFEMWEIFFSQKILHFQRGRSVWQAKQCPPGGGPTWSVIKRGWRSNSCRSVFPSAGRRQRMNQQTLQLSISTSYLTQMNVFEGNMELFLKHIQSSSSSKFSYQSANVFFFF